MEGPPNKDEPILSKDNLDNEISSFKAKQGLIQVNEGPEQRTTNAHPSEVI